MPKETAPGYFYAFKSLVGWSDLADQENRAHRQSTPCRAAFHAVLLAALLCVSLVHAANLSSASQAEIQALLSRLGASGCEFRRNGSWHPADEAQAHLQQKLDYLMSKGAVASAEQFIERAASKSSVTGQPYLVKCGGKPPLPSSEWLGFQLRDVRATSRGPAGPPK
jgi:hypothetical protein